MSKFVVGAMSDGIYEALYKAGVLPNLPDEVRRVIIDLEVNQAARIYIDTYADSRLTDAILDHKIIWLEEEETAVQP